MDISYSTEHMNLLLILIGLAVAIHFIVLKKTQKRTLNFSNYALLSRVMGRKIFHKNYPVLIIRIAIIILVVLALSDMALTMKQDVASYDYVLAVDTSPSMSENFPEIARTTSDFMEDLPKGTKIGMITFSEETTIRSGLTREHQEIKKHLINLSIGMPAGTSISKALLTSSDMLQDSMNENRSIILITDGNTEENIKFELNESLETLRNRDVSVFILGINKSDSNDYEIPYEYRDLINESTMYESRLDSGTLEMISNRTGGAFYEINDSSSLKSNYENIIKKREKNITIEATPYIIFLICALLFIEWALGATRFKTIP